MTLTSRAARPSPSFQAKGGWWVVVQFFIMAAWIMVPLQTGSLTSDPLLLAAAGVLLLSGAVCGIAGVAALKGSRTPFPRPRDGAVLITGGIYRLMRHPLYTSLVLLAFGWALLWQSPAGVLPALLQTVFFDAKARCEERFLRAVFPEYADYAARVKRFIPGVY